VYEFNIFKTLKQIGQIGIEVSGANLNFKVTIRVGGLISVDSLESKINNYLEQVLFGKKHMKTYNKKRIRLKK
jgi:hypothetical protein